jgi:sugar/nucleoside kinase (ribokinase family)
VRVPRVIVVGDLLYGLLAKIGGSVAFGTDTFAPIHVAAGGSGANVAAWLAWVKQVVGTEDKGTNATTCFKQAVATEAKDTHATTCFGVETHFVGRVGDDVLGEALAGEKPFAPKTCPRRSLAEDTCTSRAIRSPAAAAGRPP